MLLSTSVGALAASQYSQPSSQYPQSQGNDKAKSGAPQISDGEREALGKVESAPTIDAKLKAAGDFLKKYPKSRVRAEVANKVAAKIGETPDATQKVALCESFLTVFKEPADADIINPILVDTYLKSEKFDDAFRVAAPWLERNQTDVAALTEMALIGTDQAKRGNPKFVDQSQQYGAKAIELIESDKKGNLTDTQWNDYKTKWLPYIYQSMGILALVKKNNAEAKLKLQKASALNGNDPFTWVLLGQIANVGYEEMAGRFKAMGEGPARDQLLKEIHGVIDEIMDHYAHAVALSATDLQYKALHDQVMEDLTAYYKYRHENSTAGLQQLIEKYKKPATAP
jgi:hypothetical protein